MNKILNLLAVASVLSMVASDKICPDATLIKAPCKFVEVANIKCAIECNSEAELDLVAIFKSLKTSLKSTEKTFVRFVLKNYKITELPANVFADIAFDAIIIEDSTSLKKIHPAAFNGEAYRVKRLDIINTPITEIVGTGNDLFGAIQSLPNLANLRLIKTALTMIPATGIKSMSQLSYIYIEQNKALKTIGSNAFHDLPKLKTLQIKDNAIEHILYTAFTVNKVATKDPLEIRLIADHLTYDSLVETTFNSINRPVSLYVTDNGFQYIKQKIFEPFVKQNPLNVIISDTDCEDTNNDWLRKTYPKQWNDVNCFGLMNAQARLFKRLRI